MTERRTKRIINEIRELENSTKILADSGIYFHYNEEDMTSIYAMLVGPEKTPYEKGFYFFKFEYPMSYPMEPPKAKYHTQGLLLNPLNNVPFGVRFNPNLYTDGKVCLSMLNTWTGPGWVPTNTICNVLVAIQALVLNDYPLTNEPGFENSNEKELKRYNDVISYANIKISVLEMLDKQPHNFHVFKDKMIEIFIKNIDYYKNFVLEQYNIHNKKTKKEKIIESPAYSMKILPEYDVLLLELESKYNKLVMDYSAKGIEDVEIK